MAQQGTDPADRYKVHSVARALHMLELLADAAGDGGLGVTDIAEATGLSKSAAFAVLQTLLDGGYVADSGTGQQRRYRLGRSLTRLGDLARTQAPLTDLARPTLRRLADELELSVRLGIRQQDGIAVIDRVDTHGGLRIDLRMGDRELLHTTAIGKAILAAHTDADARRILGRRKLIRRTPATIVEHAALMAHLKAVRVRGYAVDDEEDYQGIICIGAAVKDHTGAGDAAISVTTLKAGLTPHRIEAIGRTLQAGAAEISTALGFRPGRGGGDDHETGVPPRGGAMAGGSTR